MSYLSAASWAVASSLVTLHDDFRVYETHPGGGLYDCLTICCPHAKVDINREGSIHVHYSPGGEAIPLLSARQWTARARKGNGTVRLAVDIMHFCRIHPDEPPAMTPHSLTYQVISRVLSGRQYDSHAWDARG